MMGMVDSHGAWRGQRERDALRLLCSDLIEPETRVQLAGLLGHYVFADELNHAVYEAIMWAGTVSARRMREVLPAKVTNLGFPDFELKEYLARNGADEDIDKLFESLLELSEAKPQEDEKAMGQSA